MPDWPAAEEELFATMKKLPWSLWLVDGLFAKGPKNILV
jgi:hypothetical protein